VQDALLIKAIKIKASALQGEKENNNTFMEGREIYHFTDGKSQV